jgi:type I restriction enzyme S subunit
MNPEWQVLPGNALFSERSKKSSIMDSHLTPSQIYGVLPQSEYMEITGNRVVLNLVGADNMKHVEPDDFIIHLRSFQGGIEHSRYAGKVSNAYCVLIPKPVIYPGFYKWVLKSKAFIQELSSTTDQLRDGQSIKFEQFRGIGFPLPPMEEQRRIADYLNHQIELINSIFEIRQQQMALVSNLDKSFKSNIITRLDLSPDWQRTRVGWSCELRFGEPFNSEDFLGSGSLPLVRMGDLGAKEFNVYVDPSTAPSSCILQNGDVIVGMSGQFSVEIWNRGKAALNQRLVAINSGFSQEILAVVIEPQLDLIAKLLPSTTLRNLSAGEIRRLKFYTPISTEVAERLTDEILEFKSVLNNAKLQLARASELQSELKTALITAAVTGQFEVTTGRSVG